MLLLDAVITEACPKDTNLAEIVEIDKQRVQLASGGHEMRPVYGGVVVRGLPFGEQSPPVLAPIDLAPGDKLRVIADVETRAVWDVTRKGKVIWENKALKDRDEAAAAEKEAKRAVLDKLR